MQYLLLGKWHTTIIKWHHRSHCTCIQCWVSTHHGPNPRADDQLCIPLHKNETTLWPCYWTWHTAQLPQMSFCFSRKGTQRGKWTSGGMQWMSGENTLAVAPGSLLTESILHAHLLWEELLTGRPPSHQDLRSLPSVLKVLDQWVFSAGPRDSY